MYKPAAPNLTGEGKARNRRVEIEFKRPELPEENQSGQTTSTEAGTQ
jgi:hypothetical protein